MELPAPTAGHAPRIADKVHEAPLKSRRQPVEALESMHCYHPAPVPSKKAAKSSDLEPHCKPRRPAAPFLETIEHLQRLGGRLGYAYMQ